MMTVDLKRMVALAEDLRAREAPPKESRARSWYRIEDRTSEMAEVYLYEEIGMWGISSKDFVAELRGVKAKKIELHINSGGGSVFEGVAIYEALLDHPAHIVSIVDALAASAASFIAMAGEEIEIKKTARMMIHDASGGVLGTAKDMREHADLLEGLSDMIAEIYADRAGGTVRYWRDLMLAETWFTADKAVEVGLANRVAGDIPPDPSDKVKITIDDKTPLAPVPPLELIEDHAGTIDPEWLRNALKEALCQ
jgi:ATP-dependent protease ClpP protease subunit